MNPGSGSRVALILLLSFMATGLNPVEGHDVHRKKATIYADHYAGKRTASGQRYNPHAKTAAHPHLPFGTKVEVTNELNGKTLTLMINDRCSHVLDLSKSAAHELGIKSTAPVAIRVLSDSGKKLATK
jgi:rare lipoprotein A